MDASPRDLWQGAGYFGFVLRSYPRRPTTWWDGRGPVRSAAGRGAAIVNVHHFGFVLPNLVPWILFPLGDDVVGWTRPALWRRRSITCAQQSPARATRRTLARALPLKTFIILGSFCQSTSFDPWQDGGPVGGGPRSYPRCGGCGSRRLAALLGHLLYTRPEMFFGSAAPLKTFIILASFCQIYYPADRRGVMDACRGTMARAGYSLFWLRSARSERSVLSRPTDDVVR
jgi:hypothetical protein